MFFADLRPRTPLVTPAWCRSSGARMGTSMHLGSLENVRVSGWILNFLTLFPLLA